MVPPKECSANLTVSKVGGAFFIGECHGNNGNRTFSYPNLMPMQIVSRLLSKVIKKDEFA
jgi:hypothetical protein